MFSQTWAIKLHFSTKPMQGLLDELQRASKLKIKHDVGFPS
jgi:hypothetical protein